MRIIPRAEWKAKPPTRPLQTDRLPWPRLWLHHTAGSATATPNDIQHQHQEINGWRDAAYNWAVNRAGTVYELLGAHRHLNSDAGQSGTIVWVGNYETTRPTEHLINSTAWLVAHGLLTGWWAAALDGAPHITGGHSQIPGAAPTACPGRFALAAIPEINRRAAQIIHDIQPQRKRPTMVIIGHNNQWRLSNGIESRPLASWAERQKWVDAGAPVVELDAAEWAQIRYRPSIPAAATSAEVVAATQTAVDQIIEALNGVTVDGGTVTGQDARWLLLELLGAK